MGFKISRGILSHYVEEKGEHSIIIPDNVKKIAASAFRDKQNLVSVEIPETVEIVDDYAFRNCRNLETVIFKGEPSKFGLLVFFGCCKLQTVESKEGICKESVKAFHKRMQSGQLMPEEGKALFKLSKAKGKVTIKEFENVYFAGGNDPKHYIYKVKGFEEFLMFPSTIEGQAVDKIPCRQIPENMVVYCDKEYFDKLDRSSRAATAAAWLKNDPYIREDLDDTMIKFIKGYPDEVAISIKGSEPVVYKRFMEIAQAKSALIKKMIEQEDNPEIVAMLLDTEKENTTDIEEELSFNTPKLTVQELKKLWTAKLYEDVDTGEKTYWITNYKGVDEHVVIPAYIGKYRVGLVELQFPNHVTSVEVESLETRLSTITKRDIERIRNKR